MFFRHARRYALAYGSFCVSSRARERMTCIPARTSESALVG